MRLLAIAVCLAVSGLVGHADAKPKSIHHVCGTQAGDTEKIQDPRVQACLDQMQKDILAGDPNPHYLLCLADGGVSCCKDVGSQGARRCDRIFRVIVPTTPLGTSPPMLAPN
jgi:hypothetical protein